MCMAAGIDPPAEIFVHGFLLMGGQKLGKTMIAAGMVGATGAERPLKITDVSPLALADDFGVDPLRYHLLRDVPLGRRRRLLLRGHRGPLQRRPGQQPRQPGVAGDHGGALQVRRGRPGLRPASELADVAAGVLEAAAAAWARWAPHEALEETWRLIGAANAELEAAEPWKMEPGPEVDAVLGDALEVLRIVAVLIVAGHALDRGRGLAPHRRARRPDGGPPARRRRLGRLSRRAAVVKGDPLFPRRKA